MVKFSILVQKIMMSETVKDVILEMSKYFDVKNPYKIINDKTFPEAGLLATRYFKSK